MNRKKKIISILLEMLNPRVCVAILFILVIAFAICFMAMAEDKDTVESEAIHTILEGYSSEIQPTNTVTTKKSINKSDWRLTLVNKWNPIPEDWTVELITIRYGFRVDERCYPDLQRMMDACRDDGYFPMVCSGYRTWESQQKLFDERVNELIQEGYTESDAAKKAAESVAVPGTSEHQLGLAVDIVDETYQQVNLSQDNTQVQQWMMENSWKYGFILRYPKDKSDITGIIYEPWHYRYVGEEAAREIHELGVCLEEYLNIC